LSLLDEQYATHHIADGFLKKSFSNELLSIAAAGWSSEFGGCEVEFVKGHTVLLVVSDG
jgi:hypothetical protein